MRARFLPALDLLPEPRADRSSSATAATRCSTANLTLGAARRVQRLRRDADLAAAHARHDHRPGASGPRRRPSGCTRCSSTEPEIVDPPDARAAAAARPGEVRFEGVTLRLRPAARPVLDGLDLDHPGRASRSRWSGRPASGKTTVARLVPRFYDVDAGRVLLDGVDVRDVRAARRCGARSASCSRTRSCSPTRIAANIAFADPDAPIEQHRAGRPAGRRRRVHRRAARRLRHRDRRARLLAVGRAAPAHRHRPGHPRRPARPDPRRRHVVGRPDEGARDPRRARRGDAGPHDDRHRPPAGHDRARRPRRAARRRPGRGRRHPRRAARHERALPRGARPPPRRRPTPRPEPTSTADDDELGRWRGDGRRADVVDVGGRRGRQARRASRPGRSCAGPVGMLRPYRRDVSSARVPRSSLYTLDHARRARSSSSTASTTASAEDDAARARTRGRRVRRRRHRRLLRVPRLRSLLVGRVGEGFLRDLRVRVFDHLQRLSMPFYDREKAGVHRLAHDLRRRLAAGARAVGPAACSSATSCSSSLSVDRARLVSWQLLLICLIPLPFVVAGQHQVPARLEPGLPHGARPHRPHAVGAAGGHRRRARHPGVRPRGRARSSGSAPTTATLYDAHMRSVRISAWYLPVIEFAGARHHRAWSSASAAGWSSTASSPSAPSPSSC